jgi:hypothetical protein
MDERSILDEDGSNPEQFRERDGKPAGMMTFPPASRLFPEFVPPREVTVFLCLMDCLITLEDI